MHKRKATREAHRRERVGGEHALEVTVNLFRVEGPDSGPGFLGEGSELPLELAREGVALAFEYACAPTFSSSLV
jgi:hypothetical protein